MKFNLSNLSLRALFCAATLIPVLFQPLAAQAPDSIAPMGQKFANPKPADTLRVLLVGAGTAHDFPKYFLAADEVTLKAAGGMDVAATPNLAEALELMKVADVLVFSGNHDQFGTDDFQKALHKFADARKGLVILHAGTWAHPWKGYNERFVGGGTPNHGVGEFDVTIKDTRHAVTKGVPATFKITDENYRFEPAPNAKIDICAENAADGGKVHSSVWIVKDPKTRIVCITLGHADEAHRNQAYKTILTNAVNWVGGR